MAFTFAFPFHVHVVVSNFNVIRSVISVFVCARAEPGFVMDIWRVLLLTRREIYNTVESGRWMAGTIADLLLLVRRTSGRWKVTYINFIQESFKPSSIKDVLRNSCWNVRP